MSSPHFDPGPLAKVSWQVAAGGWTLVYSCDFKYGPEDLWQQLTQPARLARWAPFTADRELTQPGPANLVLIGGEEKLDRTADILQVTPPTLAHIFLGDRSACLAVAVT